MRARMETAMATVGALGALCACGGAGHVTATSSNAGCPDSTPAGPRPLQPALLNFGGPPARFSASVGTPAAYGATGFAPSILQFSRAGCWKLHAHLASRVLTLVVRVAPAA